jgi:putative transposase
LQQFREAIPTDHAYRFLVRDRDSIFSAEVDAQLKVFGLRVLRTPARAPQANAYCERLVGTVRRECLDFMIPLGERHLSKVLAEWVRRLVLRGLVCRRGHVPRNLTRPLFVIRIG